MLDNLEKAIDLCSQNITGSLQYPDEYAKFISILELRILDGACTCYYLLNINKTSFVPLVARNIIESIGTINCIINDLLGVRDIIKHNNNKLRLLIECLIKSKIGTIDQVDALSRRSKKAKDENNFLCADGINLRTSDIVKSLNNDMITACYISFSSHAHNDFNELVHLYVKQTGDASSLIFINPEVSRNNISLYSSFVIKLLYYATELLYKYRSKVRDELFDELELLAASSSR